MRARKTADCVVTVINQVSRVAGSLALVFLLAMMVLTVLDVFLRYVLNNPIPGSVELTEYFMAVGCFFGLAWCAVKRGHVRVDLILRHLPPRFQAITDSITLLLGMTVVPLVAWQSFVHARYSQLVETASSILEIPDYPFYIVVGIGYVLLFLVMLTILAECIVKARKK